MLKELAKRQHVCPGWTAHLDNVDIRGGRTLSGENCPRLYGRNGYSCIAYGRKRLVDAGCQDGALGQSHNDVNLGFRRKAWHRRASNVFNRKQAPCEGGLQL